jgi:hypothetical protein
MAGIAAIVALTAQILFSTRLVLNLRESYYHKSETATEWGMIKIERVPVTEPQNCEMEGTLQRAAMQGHFRPGRDVEGWSTKGPVRLLRRGGDDNVTAR